MTKPLFPVQSRKWFEFTINNTSLTAEATPDLDGIRLSTKASINWRDETHEDFAVRLETRQLDEFIAALQALRADLHTPKETA